MTSHYRRVKLKNDIRRTWRLGGIKKTLLLVAAIMLIAAVIAMGVLITRFVIGLTSKTRDITAEGIPPYSGEDTIILNDGKPDFSEDDLSGIKGEHYSKLDSLGRCGVAYARLDRTMMPTEERGSIGMIKPSGWQTVKYPGIVQDKYLYNRCHLIAYALTGQNANEENLITGTRHLNADLMLPYEIEVAQYLDNSDNHVLYRVTPRFTGNELVARGVEMEAYSIEDQGAGVCYHVFLYNVQPGIDIDYRDGTSKESKD